MSEDQLKQEILEEFYLHYARKFGIRATKPDELGYPDYIFFRDLFKTSILKVQEQSRIEALEEAIKIVDSKKKIDYQDNGREAYHPSNEYQFPDINLKFIKGLGFNQALTKIKSILQEQRNKLKNHT